MTTNTEREAMALHLWDEGLVRPESLAFAVVDEFIAEGWASDAGRNRQTENGSCWDEGPTLPVREGECEPMPPLCELRAGHAGAHRGGRAEWMTRPASRPVITEEAVERAAEAAHYAQGFDDWGVANETEREWSVDIARAALEAAFGENHRSTEGQENR